MMKRTFREMHVFVRSDKDDEHGTLPLPICAICGRSILSAFHQTMVGEENKNDK